MSKVTRGSIGAPLAMAFPITIPSAAARRDSGSRHLSPTARQNRPNTADGVLRAVDTVLTTLVAARQAALGSSG